MKMRAVFLVCAVVALPFGATAESPAKESPAEAERLAGLGRLDAVLTLCAKADTQNRETYEAFRMQLIAVGEGTDQVMRVEGSDTPAYKDAYAAVVEAARQASAEDIAVQCGRMIGADAVKRRD